MQIAIFRGEQLEARFGGDLCRDDSQDWIENIRLLSVSILGEEVPIEIFPEKVQKLILELADNIDEWNAE